MQSLEVKSYLIMSKATFAAVGGLVKHGRRHFQKGR